jgi:hypothetical protein
VKGVKMFFIKNKRKESSKKDKELFISLSEAVLEVNNLSLKDAEDIIAKKGIIEFKDKKPFFVKDGLGIIKRAASGKKYVAWNKDKIIPFLLQESKRKQAKTIKNTNNKVQKSVFDRQAFPAEFRADDGHFLRSQGELVIDNWLFNNGILHAYEKRVPIKEELYCDFFLPSLGIYIEYFGMDDKKYKKRVATKIKLYEKYDLKLIALYPDDIKRLDDILPLKLIELGVKATLLI